MRRGVREFGGEDDVEVEGGEGVGHGGLRGRTGELGWNKGSMVYACMFLGEWGRDVFFFEEGRGGRAAGGR